MAAESRVRAAQSILDRIFRRAPFAFAARLWDGTLVSLGKEAERPFTLVFRDPVTFRRLMLRPNTLRFAEAYLSGTLDVEGDFFAALRLANQIERLELGIRDRLAILLGLLKL